MKYCIQFKSTDMDGCDVVDCERIVEADSLPRAIHEVLTSCVYKQRILEITNYYWLEE